MVTKFEPNGRQRRLIAAAKARVAQPSGQGHHAPEELVRRMTLESMVVESTAPVGEAHAAVTESQGSCLTFAVAVTGEVTREEAMARLSACTDATVFKVPRCLLLLDIATQASDREQATTEAITDVMRVFPCSEVIDLNDPNALLDQLVDAADGSAPTSRDVELMLRSTVPSDDAVALAAAAVDGLLEAVALREFSEQGLCGLRGDEAPGSCGSSTPAASAVRGRLVEAEVFEVLPGFGLAHLMSDDGRMFCVTSKTPGIANLADLKEGQRYRCWVTGRFNLVVRASSIE
ncbi:hypothetical protein G8A07_06915 [Roseateles sp. DAIF2]|uniref:hypothetical protein n=1 Tax=Roseateles sp. DAIF2 TaxID=2714952 RepID=UPI0018A2FB97|nr:hypothetical protein [Roseateles sp. DAIF2]QPF72684.1 hypothetical protein G8A07_06915 [Roseateles sp. DAIF2]